MGKAADTNWDSYACVKTNPRWRQQAAAIGRHFTLAIVAEAKLQPGMHVLDVACGAGEPSITVAGEFQNFGRVTAIDLAPEPLKFARQRALARDLKNIRFLRADVHQLPFPPASFDRVMCRLGVMFFANVDQALREMHRVLKPEGRTSLLAFGPIEQPYFQTTIGTIQRILPGLSFPESGTAMFKFGEAGSLSAALRQAGFVQVEERFATLPWTWPGTPAELWEYFQVNTVTFKPLFEAIPFERREEVNAAVIDAVGKYYCDGEIRFTATAVLASATP